MQSRNAAALVPHVGGRMAIGLFIASLLAFVVETQLSQYIQTNLGYRHPFFLFYLVHSSFSIIFPLHLLYLLATTNYTAVSLFKGLHYTIATHFDPALRSTTHFPFPLAKFIRLVLGLTFGITYPGLLWFMAISLASVSDVTAIWNTNAFFAYLITVKLFKLKWEARRLLAVVLATLGTSAVVYGSSTSPANNKQGDEGISSTGIKLINLKPTAPLLGNLLTLVASFGYGLYQVLYKIYAALPSDPEAAELLYEQISGEEEEEDLRSSGTYSIDSEMVYPPPFGLYPNLLTSMLGLTTLMVLWLPIPFLHWSGAEPFSLPPNLTTFLAIFGIALTGVVFNAGFMVLLGIWGPIIVSMGNLLTIVLVLISDVIIGGGVGMLTIWSLMGSSVIVLAFSVLAYDMFSKRV